MIAPEPGDREVHERRVARRELLVPETETLGDTGTPRLDHHVGAARERAGDVRVVVVLQVEDDAALPTRPERPCRLRAQHAAARRFDVHDVGAEIGEQLADVCPRQRVREVDCLQTVERAPPSSMGGSVRGPPLARRGAVDLGGTHCEGRWRGTGRDHRHRIAFACLAVLVACGVATFVGLRGTVHDLDRSLASFYDETRFADLVVVGGETDAFAAAVRESPGVSAVNTRTTTTLSVWIDGGRTKVQGTVIGVPSSGPPINTLSITAGQAFAPDSSSSVAVVEQHTADDLGVMPGDSVQALGIGSVEALQVTGVGVSPEYLQPAESQQQIVTAPGSFAVLYVPEALAQTLGGAAGIGQVLVRYEADADADALDQRLTRLADGHQAALVIPRSQQPSNAVIAEEQTGFEEASLVVPGLVLLLAVAVGAMAAARVEDAAHSSSPDRDRRRLGRRRRSCHRTRRRACRWHEARGRGRRFPRTSRPRNRGRARSGSRSPRSPRHSHWQSARSSAGTRTRPSVRGRRS